jgi:hypothetical protein
VIGIYQAFSLNSLDMLQGSKIMTRYFFYISVVRETNLAGEVPQNRADKIIESEAAELTVEHGKVSE